MSIQSTFTPPEICGQSLLNTGTTAWYAIKDIPLIPQESQGIQYTSAGFSPDGQGWIPAIVPSTVLNSLLHNEDWVKNNVTSMKGATDIPPFFDPYFDDNITQIPDIYNSANIDEGVAFYTYWFYTSVQLSPGNDDTRYWLNFRGINYSADVYVNGQKLNEQELQGAFLRHSFDLSGYPTDDGITRIAVRVVPPNPPGNPTGENGGYGDNKHNIGNNVTYRYPTGWDWITYMRDRSAGIWDQVALAATKALKLQHPHVITTVLDANGVLMNEATVKMAVEVYNYTSQPVTGYVKYELSFDGKLQYNATTQPMSFAASGEMTLVQFDDLTIPDPQLWWPHGCNPADPQKAPDLYDLVITAYIAEDESSVGTLSDGNALRVGIREVTGDKFIQVNFSSNMVNSRQFRVNGTPIFIHGANWIGTDAMFRLSAERYRDEIRFNKEMNLNMLRVWGGGIAERPEFYEACDEMGMLVMQDFWFSSEFEFYGDLPTPYQDAFTACATDTIKMLRNHPSLLFWCGANESEPPNQLLDELNSYIGPEGSLDNTRILVPNSLGISGSDYGDGPYGLQYINQYFTNVVNPFNPECGAVGFPVIESMRRMMREETLQHVPKENDDIGQVNPVLQLHTYSSYSVNFQSDQLYTYAQTGTDPLPSMEAFSNLAQLTNYCHYKAMWEGVFSQMWTTYTGFNIWKAHNPWPGLRSAVYDWYLEQTGGYFGVKHACEPVHVLLNLKDYPYPNYPGNQQNDITTVYDVMVVNQTTNALQQLSLNWTVYDLSGNIGSGEAAIPACNNPQASTVGVIYQLDLGPAFAKMQTDKNVYFLVLTLQSGNEQLSRNFYWLSRNAAFNELSDYPAAPVALNLSAKGTVANGRFFVQVTVSNKADLVAFWNRLQVTLPSTGDAPGERVLPVFYDDNYFSVAPNETLTVNMDFTATLPANQYPELWLQGWNQGWEMVAVEWS